MRDPGVGGSHGERWDGEHRAQLVLVAGFVLAVTFVALALLLNSAIFAENLATRQTGGTGAEAEQISGSVDRALQTQLRQINTNNTGNDSYTVLVSDLKDMTGNWSELSNRQLSTDGALLRVAVVQTTNGTRILHADRTRAWTAGGANDGAAEWTVFENVDAEDVRWYQMNVSRKDLINGSFDTVLSAVLTDAFHLTIENGGQEWDVYMFEGTATGNVYIMVEEPGDPELESITSLPHVQFLTDSCIVTEEWVTINLWAGTVDGTRCDQLSFVRNLSGSVTVEYDSATTSGIPRVKGTYDISLNTTAGVDHDNFYNPRTTGSSPYLLSSITHLRVERQIQRPDSVYTETTSIRPEPIPAPGAGDGPIPSVTFNESSVVDLGLVGSLDTKYAFDVNWQARDGGDNLRWVNVSVTDANDNLETWNRSVSGGIARGSETYVCNEDVLDSACSDTYTVVVTATDLRGNTNSTETEFDTGDDGVTLL